MRKLDFSKYSEFYITKNNNINYTHFKKKSIKSTYKQITNPIILEKPSELECSNALTNIP